MAMQPLDLVGTWEEILQHSRDLAGQRVRVTVLPRADQRATNGDVVRPASGRSLMRHVGTWAGDDLEACLQEVIDDRAPVSS